MIEHECTNVLLKTRLSLYILSRPVLPIGSGREWRCEVDGQAHGVWRIELASGWGQSKASHVGGQRR